MAKYNICVTLIGGYYLQPENIRISRLYCKAENLLNEDYSSINPVYNMLDGYVYKAWNSVFMQFLNGRHNVLLRTSLL